MNQRQEKLHAYDIHDLVIGIAILDYNWQILHANTCFGELVGIPRDRLEGSHFEELITILAPEGLSWRQLAQTSPGHQEALAIPRTGGGHASNELLLATVRQSDQDETLLAQLQHYPDKNERQHTSSGCTSEDAASIAQYMSSLLPDNMQSRLGVEIRSRYIPSEKLAGDCYDYFWLANQKLLIYLADISGHGIRSTLQAVSLHSMIKSASFGADAMLNPSTALSRLNNLFPIEKHLNYFTIWYGIYDTHSKELQYSTGGHPPGLIIRGSSDSPHQDRESQFAVQQLSTSGLGIGLMEEAEYHNGSITLSPGDRLLLFSDGLFEFFDQEGQIWSYKKLHKYIERNGRSMNEQTLTDALMGKSKSGQFQDDCSVLLISFV